MTRDRQDRAQRLARERALYVYGRALAAGDFETMARIHEQAEVDPVLERQLDELLDADAAGLPELALADDADVVRDLLARHITGAQAEDGEAPAPITVGEVAGKLRAERRVSPQDEAALAQLLSQSEQVPARLGLGEVRRFGQRLGVAASDGFWRLFREAALLLGVGQSQQAGLAAARRSGQGQAREQREGDEGKQEKGPKP
jgi:hypothetical protein